MGLLQLSKSLSASILGTSKLLEKPFAIRLAQSDSCVKSSMAGTMSEQVQYRSMYRNDDFMLWNWWEKVTFATALTEASAAAVSWRIPSTLDLRNHHCCCCWGDKYGKLPTIYSLVDARLTKASWVCFREALAIFAYVLLSQACKASQLYCLHIHQCNCYCAKA